MVVRRVWVAPLVRFRNLEQLSVWWSHDLQGLENYKSDKEGLNVIQTITRSELYATTQSVGHSDQVAQQTVHSRTHPLLTFIKHHNNEYNSFAEHTSIESYLESKPMLSSFILEWLW